MTVKQAEYLLKSYLEDMKKILPKAELHSQSWSSVDDNVGGLELEFKAKQNSFEETVFHTEVNNQYIHYTSVDSMFNILNEESVRCYPAKQLNDPQEILGIIKKLNLDVNKKMIEDVRKSLYIFSMCKYDEGNQDDFNMWRLYGREGHGVGIVFEVENENRYWHSNLIGDVQYGTTPQMETLFKESINLCLKYAESNLNSDKFPVILNHLMALHKNEIWSFEKEARCVTYFEYDPMYGGIKSPYDYNISLKNLGYFIDDEQMLSPYFKLDLSSKFNRETEKFDEEDISILRNVKLRLKVKKIICGYKLSTSFVYSLRRFLNIYSFSNKLGYDIEIRPSKFNKYF